MTITRVIPALPLILLAACFETGFVASIPGPLGFLPFTLAAGTYLTQSRGWWGGPWLIAGFGLFSDAAGLSPIPGQTFAYAAAAAAAWLSARELFSNRSLYGILGCGVVAWGAHTVTQTLIWAVQRFTRGGADLSSYASWVGWRLVLSLFLLSIFFYAVPRKTRVTFTAR